MIKLDDEDMKTLNEMAGSGKQKRVNTPLFGWDLVSDPRFAICASGQSADSSLLPPGRVSMTGTEWATRMLRVPMLSLSRLDLACKQKGSRICIARFSVTCSCLRLLNRRIMSESELDSLTHFSIGS